MSQMSRADAELVYKYLNDRVRGDVEADAYDAALDEFEDLSGLEAANDDPEVVVENIREKIREMQEDTMFSPRELVALVLDAEWDEQNAATLMDVSVGNFRGKKGSIADKVEKAEKTLNQAELIRGE